MLEMKDLDNYLRPKYGTCPVCGSVDVGLYNSAKQTYHCHECDSYWNKKCQVIEDNYHYRQEPPQATRGRWNGFTDSGDFPTDGYDGSGW